MPAPIRGPGHDATQRVHFPRQMALADAADGRVAAHLAQGVQVVGQEQRARSDPRGRQGRLGSGVATTDDDAIECIRVFHGFT